MSSIPGLGRSPGEGNGNPLQCSCLGNPMDRRAWSATVHGVARGWTGLSDKHLGSVRFSCLVMSNSFRPHGLQHTTPPCPSPTPGASSNSTSIESVMPCNHLIFCCPLLFPPSIFPSIRVFSNESVLHSRWPKYWSFSFSISPSNEYSGLISFRMDWLDLLVVQGTLKSLLQHQSSKVSVLRCSAFFTIQLSHSYMTAGKTIALTRWTFVGKAMSLLFNMLSRFVIPFLPRSKHLLMSWLQSVVDLGGSSMNVCALLL